MAAVAAASSSSSAGGFQDAGRASSAVSTRFSEQLDRTQLPGDAGATGSESALDATASGTQQRWHVPAYFHNRAIPRARLGPSATDVHWNRQPWQAAQMHPADLFQHQALHWRSSPQPNEGAMKRWPETGLGTCGMPEPLDDRQHQQWFGYRQQRWKGVYKEKTDDPVPELTIENLVVLLTYSFGSAKTAFDHLDFFRDGKLSLVEWQEGIYKYLTTGSHPKQYRCICEPRWLYNERMKRLFYSMDTDQDGLISFEEFIAPQKHMYETAREFTLRRDVDQTVAGEHGLVRSKSLRSSQPSMTTLHSEDLPKLWNTPKDGGRPAFKDSTTAASSSSTARGALSVTQSIDAEDAPAVSHQLRQFAGVIMQRFASHEDAFSHFDSSGNDQLSMAEFQAAVKGYGIVGDVARAIFRELDVDGSGIISAKEFKLLRQLRPLVSRETAAPPKRVPQFEDYPEGTASIETASRRDFVEARKARSPIKKPPVHARGLTLESGHLTRPLHEKVSASKDFYSFKREATGRLDDLLHSEQLPGVDVENFNPEHGPGYLKKGPEYFSESGCHAHPMRGNGFKLGSCTNKTERFGRLVPSKQARLDHEHGGVSYATYGGQRPRDTWTVSQTGACMTRSNRQGHTMSTSDAMGVLGPKPIGPWAISRTELGLRARSTPSLLRHVA